MPNTSSEYEDNDFEDDFDDELEDFDEKEDYMVNPKVVAKPLNDL